MTSAIATPVAEAFREMFDEQYDYVWRSLRRLGVHDRDVEDVAHETFLEVYAKLDQLDRQRPIRPWLFAFALRFASDYRKLARHRTELVGEVDVARSSSLVSPEDAALQRESERLLHAALETLSLGLRAVIILYEIEEVPMKEITEALGIPLHTGYSRLRLAREQCAKALEAKR